MSKGAKFHTYHTNLSITYYYYYVLGPVFVCDFKTEVLKSTWERNQKEQSNIREHGLKVVFYSPISHLASAPLLPYSLEPDAPTPTHKQPDSSFQTDISMVSSDMPQSHPLPPFPSLHCFSHTGLPLALCSCYPYRCYMSMSLVRHKECLVTQPCVSVLDKREPQHYCDQHKQHYNTWWQRGSDT